MWPDWYFCTNWRKKGKKKQSVSVQNRVKLTIALFTLTLCSGMDFRTFENENVPPLSSSPAEVPLPKYPIWTVEYFQKYFDVTSEDVLERIKGALVPTYGVNFLQRHIRAKPDVYGPFWICLTLVFSIAISGNVANYIQVAAHHNYHWKYNFHAVSSAATAIYMYAWLLPLILWAFVKYKEPQVTMTNCTWKVGAGLVLKK